MAARKNAARPKYINGVMVNEPTLKEGRADPPAAAAEDEDVEAAAAAEVGAAPRAEVAAAPASVAATAGVAVAAAATGALAGFCIFVALGAGFSEDDEEALEDSSSDSNSGSELSATSG